MNSFVVYMMYTSVHFKINMLQLATNEKEHNIENSSRTSR